MYVIEVQPAIAWRAVRLNRGSHLRASLVRAHARASHFFREETAAALLPDLTVRHRWGPLTLGPDRRRIRFCRCAPLTVAPPRRLRRAAPHA